MLIDFKTEFNPLLQAHPFFIIDVGARGGLKQEWVPLKPYLKIVGFEADKLEHEKLSNSSEGNFFQYINSAVFDSKIEVTLHRTKIAGLSSVYMPNYDFLKNFHETNTHGYALQEKIRVPADTLDHLLSEAGRDRVDFIKIDVEGCAFEVLKGAYQTMTDSELIGVRVEAELNEKYAGERLFSEVDLLLRKQNFELFHMKSCYWKRKAGLKTAGAQGQLIHGDFVYFTRIGTFLDKIRRKSADERFSKVIKYIIFCCVYGYYDLAFEMVDKALADRVLTPIHAEKIRKALSPSGHFLMRIPKLKGKHILADLFYHAFMFFGGVFLERTSFWKSQIRL